MMEGVTTTRLLKQVAGEFPSKRVLSVSGKFDLTYSHLHEERATSGIIAAGIRAGDVVALTFPATVESVLMFMAVIRARATALPLNSAYTSEEFEFYLSDSESKLLLTNHILQTQLTQGINLSLEAVLNVESSGQLHFTNSAYTSNRFELRSRVECGEWRPGSRRFLPPALMRALIPTRTDRTRTPLMCKLS